MTEREMMKAAEMRQAIDAIELAMMGLGDFVDLPIVFGPQARADLVLTPKMKLGEVRRVCEALAECTRIINSPAYDVFAACAVSRSHGESQ